MVGSTPRSGRGSSSDPGERADLAVGEAVVHVGLSFLVTRLPDAVNTNDFALHIVMESGHKNAGELSRTPRWCL